MRKCGRDRFERARHFFERDQDERGTGLAEKFEDRLIVRRIGRVDRARGELPFPRDAMQARDHLVDDAVVARGLRMHEPDQRLLRGARAREAA